MIRGFMLLLIASAAALAVEIPDTLVVDGQTYTGVVYQSHDASRLRVMHETGVAALPIANLPTELQAKLGYDEKAAQAAEAAANAAAANAAAAAAKDPHGERPLFDQSWGRLKVPAAVERAVRERLADPSSLQITKLVSLEKADYQGVKCWQMIFQFSGRNRMGGVTPMAAMAYVKESQLLGIQFFED
jgi:hypothetical protein